MQDRRDEGSWAWRQAENHNHMIELQDQSGPSRDSSCVELAYFGGSAFRIMSPAGLTIMIDPWRNPPWGTWDWYLYDFPRVKVDIGRSKGKITIEFATVDDLERIVGIIGVERTEQPPE